MPDQLAIVVERRGAIVKFLLSGELDLNSAQTLSERIDSLQVEGVEVIELDLSALRFLDSTGLSLAFRAHSRACREGRRLVIIPGPPQVQKPFEITGLNRILEFAAAPQPSMGHA